MNSLDNHTPPLSPRRSELCSHENAQRVAGRMFDEKRKPVSVVRTGDPFKPYHVAQDLCGYGDIEIEIRV